MKTFVAATLAVVLATTGLATAREPGAYLQRRFRRDPSQTTGVIQPELRGMRRLDLAGLATRTRLFLRLMEHAASVRDCAAIARGGSPAAVQSAMSRISEVDREEWMTMTAAAVQAEVLQTAPLPMDQQALQRAYVATATRVPAAERQRFGKALQNLAAASDEDACWASKKLYVVALELPPPHRQLLLRSLAE